MEQKQREKEAQMSRRSVDHSIQGTSKGVADAIAEEAPGLGAEQIKNAQRTLLTSTEAHFDDVNDEEQQVDGMVMKKDATEHTAEARTPAAGNGVTDSFPRPMPEPIPVGVPASSSGTRNSRATAPGAYADGGGGPPRLIASIPRQVIQRLHYNSMSPDEEQPQNPGKVPNNEGLVQANPVFEEEEARKREALPRAEQQKHSEMRSSSNKITGTVWAVIAVLVALVVVIVIVVTLLVDSSEKDKVVVVKNATSTLSPSANPSSAPSASWLLEDLPLDTLEAITNDPSSYQARAYQWLREDPNRETENYSQARLGQRFALACIYYATQPSTIDVADVKEGSDIVGWERSDGWLTYDRHECDWLSRGGFGFESFPNRESLIQALNDFNTFLRSGNRTAFIEWEAKLDSFEASKTCNEEGLYTNLFLYKNNLVGEVPNEIFTYLTDLKSMDLTFNFGLGGTISSDIARLTDLEFLWLGYNALTGELPSELSNLSALQIMHIVNTQVSGPIPSEIGTLTELVFLTFTGSRLSSSIPKELSQLVYLMNLDLSRSQLTGTIPSSLGNISGLRTFRLFDSQVSGSIPSELGGLQELDIFDLSNCHLSSNIPSEIGLLNNTPFLNLQQNQLSGAIPTELGNMKELTELLLYDNLLSGSLPVELYGLEKLTTLQVHDNPFLAGPIGSPELIHTGMPALEVWTLTNTSLSGELPESLCNAGGLELSFNCSDILCGCNCSCSSISV